MPLLRTTSAAQELELPLFQASPGDDNVRRFIALLREHGQLTRRQFGTLAGWTDREVRILAEAAGAEVVRGQGGFSLTSATDAEQILRAADAAISQGKKMIRYGLALQREYHKLG